MKKTLTMNHNTKLIKGVFKKKKAQRLLSELLAYKINFHGIEKFSNEERFGKDLEHSEKRILELKKENSELNAWLKSIPEDDEIEINCDIKMERK
ncbi:MAG: hypothetical protein R2850_10955 [Bacteroidia bacterium]